MRQIPIIAFNAFMELVRQPVFLLLFCVSSLLIIILAAVPYFGFGGTDLSPVNADIKMVKDGALSVMFISGLLAAVICASSSLSREISTGTALAVLSKPVGRMHFIIGKYLGIIGGLSVGTYLNLIVLLLASRQAYDAYGNPDIVGVMTLGIFIALAFIFAGLANYFFQKPFVPWAMGMLAVSMTLGFLTVCTQDKKRAWWLVDSGAGISAKFSDIWIFTSGAGIDADGKPIPTAEKAGFADDVDWSLTLLAILILMALWVLAAIAVMCSTRLGWMPTMLICAGVFIVGLMSDYLLGESAEGGGLLRPGEYMTWSPPDNQAGNYSVCRLQIRGIPRLADMNYRVEVDVTGSKPELNAFKSQERLICLGSVQTNVVQIDYERLKGLLDYDLKERWNVPVEQEMIRLGRRLMPKQFPGDSVDLTLLPRMEEALAESEAVIERDESKEEDLTAFRRLEDQVKTPVVPGHLAFWVELENGQLNKWDSSTEREVGITGGSVWAKILYVLVPNWQLFWLSDSVNVQADELGETRFKTEYDQGTVPVKYLGTAGMYVFLYVTLALSIAIWLFENRELSGEDN
tara:strand:- start:6066 stop:7790 length:1725 start_codon:yes stop_codon:yes gene_type:complete